jgi:hypothetical protein
VDELARFLAQVDLLDSAPARRDRDRPGAVRPAVSGDDPEVVEAEQAGIDANGSLGGLNGERMARAAAIGVEVNALDE